MISTQVRCSRSGARAQANAAQFPERGPGVEGPTRFRVCCRTAGDLQPRHDAKLFGIRADGGVIFIGLAGRTLAVCIFDVHRRRAASPARRCLRLGRRVFDAGGRCAYFQLLLGPPGFAAACALVDLELAPSAEAPGALSSSADPARPVADDAARRSLTMTRIPPWTGGRAAWRASRATPRRRPPGAPAPPRGPARRAWSCRRRRRRRRGRASSTRGRAPSRPRPSPPPPSAAPGVAARRRAPSGEQRVRPQLAASRGPRPSASWRARARGR